MCSSTTTNSFSCRLEFLDFSSSQVVWKMLWALLRKDIITGQCLSLKTVCIPFLIDLSCCLIKSCHVLDLKLLPDLIFMVLSNWIHILINMTWYISQVSLHQWVKKTTTWRMGSEFLTTNHTLPLLLNLSGSNNWCLIFSLLPSMMDHWNLRNDYCKRYFVVHFKLC